MVASAPPARLGEGEDTRRLLEVLERANAIVSTTSLDDLLERMLDLIIEVSGADAGTLYLLDQAAQELIFKVIKGVAGSEQLLGTRIGVQHGIVGATVREARPIFVEDIKSEPRWQRTVLDQEGSPLHNVLSLPLLVGGEPIGAVQIFNLVSPELQLIQLLSNRMASEVEKARLLAASERRERRLEALIQIADQLGATLERKQILPMILDYARQLLDAEASSLFLVDERTGDMVLELSSGDFSEQVEKVRVPAGKGIIGHVVQTGETVLVADVRSDQRHYGGVDQSSGFVTRSLLAVPLRTRTILLGSNMGFDHEHIIGGLEALNKQVGTFDADDMRLLETFADQAARALEIARLYEDINELFLDVIESLTAAIDAKDPYTEGHSKRVSDYSVEIARELGLTPEMLHHIKIGGILHDVGKIGVPDHVLKKPDRLTEEEFAEIKKHPTIGERIMGGVRMLETEIPALAEHHERLDGKGYPKGLRDEQISLLGRIVAVADVFDAVTSDRPYRAGMPVEKAFAILRSGIGTEFDGRCVEALIAAYERGIVRTQKEREITA